jgi:hypothetical protein
VTFPVIEKVPTLDELVTPCPVPEMFPVNIVLPVPELLTQEKELGAFTVTMFPEIVNVPDPEFIIVVVDAEFEPLTVPTMLAELVPDKFTKFE